MQVTCRVNARQVTWLIGRAICAPPAQEDGDGGDWIAVPYHFDRANTNHPEDAEPA